ncbi:MAG: hypothetical protein H7843_01330 [Nitrospirota bacterium]
MGNDDYGKTHIEKKRIQKIKNAGYKNVESFIEDVSKNYNQIWEQPNGRLMIVRRNGDAKIAVIELKKCIADSYYGVTTGFIAGPDYPSKGGRKLRQGGERTPSVSPEQLTPLTNTAPSEAQVNSAWRTGQVASTSIMPQPNDIVKASKAQAQGGA